MIVVRRNDDHVVNLPYRECEGYVMSGRGRITRFVID
jgi:hypothetical protein